MIEAIGSCTFCGQTKMVRREEDLTQEEKNRQANWEATMQCGCEMSKAWSERQSNINYAQSYIKNKLRATEEVKDVLLKAAEIIGNDYADKVVINHGEVDFKVYEKKGKIIVKKKKVIEEGMSD